MTRVGWPGPSPEVPDAMDPVGGGTMRAIVAGILTAAILAAMLVLGSRGPVETAPPDGPRSVDAPGGVGASPAEEAVRGLLKSGEEGDVAGYLAAFAGPLNARLSREVDQRGREAFADDLRRAAMARKSHAVFAAEPDGDLAARVTVESVYPDRNERQTYRVERTDDGWRVVEVATVMGYRPSAKFGAPASGSLPEVAPAQGAPPTAEGLTVEAGEDSASP